MRLAAHFGCTLEELRCRMSSEEVTRWIAFDNLYGFPDVYFAVAQICSAVSRPFSKKPPKPSEFVPFFAPQRGRTKQTVADHKAFFLPFLKPPT